MIQITPQHTLILKVSPVDFRKGIDALIGLCRALADPYSGTIFAFRNKAGSGVKLLIYDGSGFWLCHKRFSKGKLRFWPHNINTPICATQMMVILNQGSPVSLQPSWRKLPASASSASLYTHGNHRSGASITASL